MEHPRVTKAAQLLSLGLQSVRSLCPPVLLLPGSTRAGSAWRGRGAAAAPTLCRLQFSVPHPGQS